LFDGGALRLADEFAEALADELDFPFATMRLPVLCRDNGFHTAYLVQNDKRTSGPGPTPELSRKILDG
jgi:hypothetical protein